VGYGDYFPVTPGGQVTAGVIMAIGILTLAVVTAQVASSFFDQSTRTDAPSSSTDSPSSDVSVADLVQRLDRIEALLSSATRLSE
jgi:Ion channel